MRRAAIVLTLVVVLVFSLGCSATNSSRQGTARKQQDTDAVPLLLGLSFPTNNNTEAANIEERALLVSWDTLNGSVSFAKEALPKEKFSRDHRFIASSACLSLSDRDRASMSQLLPANASNPCQLLFSGTQEDYLLLGGYDRQAKDGAGTGGLLLGRFKNKHMKWQEVKGLYPNPNAAYTPDVVKVGNRIYLDGKCGLDVKMIDLKHEPLEVVDYRLANNLIRQVEDIVNAPELPPVALGSYKDILLVSMSGGNEIWVWALQNDKCIGKLCLNPDDNKLVVYEVNSKIERPLPTASDWIRLPE